MSEHTGPHKAIASKGEPIHTYHYRHVASSHERAQGARCSAHRTMASERRAEKFSPPTIPLRGISSWREGVGADRTGRAGAGSRSPVPGLGVASRPPTRPAQGPTSCEPSAPPRTRTTRRPRAVERGEPVISQARCPSQSP
eukprot:4389752-Pleurochrysis_carterae.AAC.4